jgi:hypothetical protein
MVQSQVCVFLTVRQFCTMNCFHGVYTCLAPTATGSQRNLLVFCCVSQLAPAPAPFMSQHDTRGIVWFQGRKWPHLVVMLQRNAPSCLGYMVLWAPQPTSAVFCSLVIKPGRVSPAVISTPMKIYASFRFCAAVGQSSSNVLKMPISHLHTPNPGRRISPSGVDCPCCEC